MIKWYYIRNKKTFHKNIIVAEVSRNTNYSFAQTFNIQVTVFNHIKINLFIPIRWCCHLFIWKWTYYISSYIYKCISDKQKTFPWRWQQVRIPKQQQQVFLQWCGGVTIRRLQYGAVPGQSGETEQWQVRARGQRHQHRQQEQERHRVASGSSAQDWQTEETK